MSQIKHDAVSELLSKQIESGISQINKANETLLAEETGTKSTEIDKILKAEMEKIASEENFVSELPESVLKSFGEAQAAFKVYKENLESARNTYRTEILGEEAKDTSNDVDKEALKEVRKVVMDAITFLKSYAAGNGRKDLVSYADGLQVPQVGRQGVSSVGQKKPRVFVKQNVGTPEEKIWGSFTEAAAALSTKDNKVAAGDLSSAWVEAGGNEGDFVYGEVTLNVTFKPKTSEGK